MDLRLFFDNFDAIAAAPNGVKKLRELILQLAVRGKLVPQDPADEPAGKLLEEIRIEKEYMFQQGRIKQTKPLPEITVKELPYELPLGWEWVRLGEIGETNIGLTYDPTEISTMGIPVLRSNNIQNGKIDLTDLKRVNTNIKENVLVQQGDLLICARNGSRALVGKTALIAELPEKMAFGAFMAIFRSRANEFLLWFINSPLFRKMIDEVNTTTINQITQNNLKTTICPLPPLAEQKRIVAKVDELMKLCDRLETQQQQNRSHLTQMQKSAIAQLLSAPDADAFGKHWQDIVENFELLFDDVDAIGDLRQAILQLAVQGKLVRQDSADEPAITLVKTISQTKKRLTQEKKIKKSTPPSPISEDDIPYEIPENWEWVRLDEITDIGTGTTPLTSNPDYYIDGNIPWITSTATSQDFITSSEQYVTLAAVTDHRLRLYPKGTLIVALYGQGKTRGQVANLLIEATINQACAAIVFVEAEEVLSTYIYYFFRKKYDELRALAAGGAQPNLNVGKIKETLVPLPPLAEQKRIVAKVNQLMTLCDTLQSHLTQRQQQSIDLAEVAVRQVLDRG
jgi:type I restriction enzyme, S subunit